MQKATKAQFSAATIAAHTVPAAVPVPFVNFTNFVNSEAIVLTDAVSIVAARMFSTEHGSVFIEVQVQVSEGTDMDEAADAIIAYEDNICNKIFCITMHAQDVFGEEKVSDTVFNFTLG